LIAPVIRQFNGPLNGGLLMGLLSGIGAYEIVVFAGGARHVPNDGALRGFGFVLAVVFALNSRDGAEELIGDVGEDGGTARGNLVVRERQEKAREEIVYGRSGFELVEVGGEGGGQIE
jgi:hypothetical protein